MVLREVTTLSLKSYVRSQHAISPQTDYTGGRSAATDAARECDNCMGLPAQITAAAPSPDLLICGDDPLICGAAVRCITQPIEESGDLYEPAEAGEHVQVRARIPAQNQEKQV